MSIPVVVSDWYCRADYNGSMYLTVCKRRGDWQVEARMKVSPCYHSHRKVLVRHCCCLRSQQASLQGPGLLRPGATAVPRQSACQGAILPSKVLLSSFTAYVARLLTCIFGLLDLN